MASVKLSEISTRAPGKLDKEKTKAKTATMLAALDELQNLLYAESKHSVLIVIQGMDASGKDGVIRNVFGNLNPQGVTVQSFKAPTPLELSHDFLWRIHQHTPPKGMMQLFNRSHYEDILITRVHKLIDDDIAKKRMKAINDFEDLLVKHNHTHVLKFYLHVSKEEQHKRLEERLSDKTKQWKYNEKDFEEAKLWDVYMNMYEDCFKNCNTVPWHIIPADQNWYKEYLITEALYTLLKSLNMRYPGLKK
ncbi:polyphosphate kinase [Panacibacter sp. DH6]|uniref:Polyphosphate kinase n=1 Tax=Panacibacter microcysteis TaxID=2793269 RepID=A0A931E6P9_9BACT|nr:PPK2 family polyphosphate kinase [Panacibacter microcysteis]MBG9376280.1 polyphosphate kinase [Panacibacter microcysteis]